MNDAFELCVRHAAELDARAQQQAWLIESLWLRSAVGLVGGAPKCCKSWLGLDMAVSVASNTPCLGRYPVCSPGPVLIYLAEDSLSFVRQRLDALCAHRSLVLSEVPLYAIDAPSLQLDSEKHAAALHDAVARLRPKLLLLDPLIRLHTLDENSSHDMSALLNRLRNLQRTFDVAVVLVHHMSKKRRAQPGQALRGSGDLHAFADSALYLTRRGDEITATVEHRAAAAPPPIRLRLDTADGQPHLEVVRVAGESAAPSANISATQKVLDALSAAGKPLTRVALRNKVRINNMRLGQILTDLEQRKFVCRCEGGWRLVGVETKTSAFAANLDSVEPSSQLLLLPAATASS